MKKFIKKSVIILLAAMLLLLSACGGNGNNAAATAEPAAPTAEPEESMQTILDSIANVEWGEAKNVILFIADGMGKNHIPATDSATGGKYNGKLAIEYLNLVADVCTLTNDSGNGEPDSACGGTALSTGYRSIRKYVGLDWKGNTQKNVCELCKELGKSSGVVTTQTVFDATPATFTAHVTSRHDTDAIIKDQLTTAAADLIIGGGANAFNEYFTNNPETKDALAANNTRWTSSWDDVKSFDGNGRMVATVTDEYWSDIDKMSPTLAEITETSINILSKNEKGFFLMVEAGALDEAAHNADLPEVVDNMLSLDAAVEIAIKYAVEHKDTIVIVTSDHNTSDLLPIEEATAKIESSKSDTYIYDEAWCLQNAELHCLIEAEKIAKEKSPSFDWENVKYRFATIKHVNDNVDLWAIGPGVTENLGFTTKTYYSFYTGKFIGKVLSGAEFGSTLKTGK